MTYTVSSGTLNPTHSLTHSSRPLLSTTPPDHAIGLGRVDLIGSVNAVLGLRGWDMLKAVVELFTFYTIMYVQHRPIEQ